MTVHRTPGKVAKARPGNVTSAGGRAGAVALLILVIVVDQATKFWVLGLGLANGPMEVTPFLDLTLVMNRGISYGLFQQDGVGRWVLVAATVAASLALAAWLWRAKRPAVRLGLGAIVGGAIGNLIDRAVYGAVVDFVHLHYGSFSWYVFNVADAAIVLGVAALLLDGLVGGHDAADG